MPPNDAAYHRITQQLISHCSQNSQYPMKLFFRTIFQEKKRKALAHKWLGLYVMPWNQPFNDIREYFGEKITLYFQFLTHYTVNIIYSP